MAERTILDLASAAAVDASTYGVVHRPTAGEAERATLPALVRGGADATPAAGAVPKADGSSLLATGWLGAGTASSSKVLRGDRTWADGILIVREQDGSPAVVASALEAGDRLIVADGGGGVARVGLRPPYHVIDLVDDFAVGTITSGGIGNLGWSGAAASFAVQASTAAHPGIVRLSTTASSGNIARLHSGPAATDGTLNVGATDLVAWSIRIPTITNVRVRLGLAADWSTTLGGAAFVGFDFDSSANANWRAITRSGGTETATSTGVAVVANNWYVLLARRLSSGNWEFCVNESAPLATHSTNLPSGALAWGASVETLTIAARTLDMDFAWWRSAQLQRYT